MLTREKVLEFWRTEEYKKLSRYLIKKYSGSSSGYIYGKEDDKTSIIIQGKDYTFDEIIEFLDDMMVPFSSISEDFRQDVYFRGDTYLNPAMSCKKENYLSVSKNLEDAIQFINDSKGGTLSFIQIDPNVKCLKIGVEGEILLQHGCLWKAGSLSTYEHTDFDGNKISYHRVDVNVYSPSSDDNFNYPYCSKLIPAEATEELVNQAKVSIDVYRERLRPFYNQYMEETREFEDSPKKEEFLETVKELNNIPSEAKRDLYSEFRNTNTSRQTTSPHIDTDLTSYRVGKKTKPKTKKRKGKSKKPTKSKKRKNKKYSPKSKKKSKQKARTYPKKRKSRSKSKKP